MVVREQTLVTLTVDEVRRKRRFGSRVTVIERNRKFLPREDEDISDRVATLFSDEQIHVVFGAEPISVAGRSGENVKFVLRQNGSAIAVAGIAPPCRHWTYPPTLRELDWRKLAWN